MAHISAQLWRYVPDNFTTGVLENKAGYWEHQELRYLKMPPENEIGTIDTASSDKLLAVLNDFTDAGTPVILQPKYSNGESVKIQQSM